MVQRPDEVLGYPMGAAGVLPDWGEIVGYFEGLAAASERVRSSGWESTDGLPYIAVTISSPENLARRDELRSILARLYDPRGLDHRTRKRGSVEDGPVTAFLLCTQHSNEIGAALMTLELAADLATPTTPRLRRSSTTS